MAGRGINLVNLGLYASEKEILDLWDGGLSILEIANVLDKHSTLVKRVVDRFKVSGLNPEHEMVRRGSEMLLAAIRKHHPEQCERHSA